MKSVLVLFLILVTSSSWASNGNSIGIGYVAKADKTTVYANSTGDEVDAVVNAYFPFAAFDANGILYGNMASERFIDGRVHVRYWENGENSSGGENTAWLNPADIVKFSFDCCGDQSCSGIKGRIFQSSTYSDCFVLALNNLIQKQSIAAKTTETANLQKIKLELEIEKLKMEMEKLKQPGREPGVK